MANEGSTKATYSELEAENLRVRGLLQRLIVYGSYHATCLACDKTAVVDAGLNPVHEPDCWLLKELAQVPMPEPKERRKGWEWRTGGGQAKGYIAESGDGLFHAERRKTQKMIDYAAHWSQQQSWEICQCGEIRGHHAFGSGFLCSDPDKCKKFALASAPPNFPQSSSLVSEGAESADIGKLDSADEKSDV